jgi:hypothetical protein
MGRLGHCVKARPRADHMLLANRSKAPWQQTCWHMAPEGINVDGCRVACDDGRPLIESRSDASLHAFGNGLNGSRNAGTTTQGRWPANLIHDGSDEVVGLFPANDEAGLAEGRSQHSRILQRRQGCRGRATRATRQYFDSGSAARFFYCAKASKDDRSDGNTHPTVKPTDLMRYLCRLVTPPGGIVLDPFMGSGSTGKAAMLEGLVFIGIEREAAYHAIAESRIGRAAAAGCQPSLPL